MSALSHPKLDMDTILAFTSLWWFTDTFPSSIYIYRQVCPTPSSEAPKKNDRKPREQILTMASQVFGPKAGGPQPKPKKPLGYSFLPHDLGSAPIHWVEKEYNVVWSKTHKDVSFHHLVL